LSTAKLLEVADKIGVAGMWDGTANRVVFLIAALALKIS
jgi:hypothetical protein